MRKSIWMTLLTIFMLTAVLGGDQAPTPRDPRFAKVDRIFAEWDKPDTPGCVIGIIENGRLLYAKGYGMANLDYNIPLTPRSVVYIASTSKQFTAACVALLVLRGQVSLEDDIRKYFPEIPDYGTPVRVRNLIHHTSGIRDYLGLMSLAGLNFEDYFNDDTALEWIVRQKKLNFTPGAEYNYSNSGYVLLAELVRRVSGRSLRQFADENIFKPLGMSRTHFDDDRSLVIKDRVISYAPLEEDAVPAQNSAASGKAREAGKAGGYRQFFKNFDAVGDGDLLTTIEDLLKWDQNFYDPKVGGAKFVDLILTRGKLNDGKDQDYAFGLMHGEYGGLKTVSHGGAMLGFRTEILRFPNQRFTVICLSNLSTFNPAEKCQKVADLFLADKLKAPDKKPGSTAAPVSISPAILDSYAGKYRLSVGPVISVLRDGGGLSLEIAGQPKMGLAALSEKEFLEEKTGLKLTFKKDDKSGDLRIDIHAQGTDITAEKLTIKSPTTEQLREYAGTYACAELDSSYALYLDGDKLMVRVKKTPPQRLEMTDSDAFASPTFKLVFTRDAGRKITGFAIDAGRVMNLAFQRQ
jgi:CubicO group peptidase (beta-lactamase class C family)